MKKFTFLLLFLTIFVATPALAAPNINELTNSIATKAGYEATDAGATALSQQVGGLIKVAMTLVGTIFLVLTVYAGFLWMTASGNEERVTKATNILKMAVIGLIIVLASYSITTFVVGYAVGTTQSDVSAVGSTTSGSSGGSFWKGFGEGWLSGWNTFTGGGQ